MPRLLTRKEAMEYLRVSHQTLKNLMDSGLPYVRLGRKVLFKLEDIDRYLEERTVISKPKEKDPGK